MSGGDQGEGEESRSANQGRMTYIGDLRTLLCFAELLTGKSLPASLFGQRSSAVGLPWHWLCARKKVEGGRVRERLEVVSVAV